LAQAASNSAPNALIFPIKEICRRARNAGLLSIIDGAHTLGQIPLDLEDIGADFYAANAHKWYTAPKSVKEFLSSRRMAFCRDAFSWKIGMIKKCDQLQKRRIARAA
jgi:hypothetical protein